MTMYPPRSYYTREIELDLGDNVGNAYMTCDENARLVYLSVEIDGVDLDACDVTDETPFDAKPICAQIEAIAMEWLESPEGDMWLATERYEEAYA